MAYPALTVANHFLAHGMAESELVDLLRLRQGGMTHDPADDFRDDLDALDPDAPDQRAGDWHQGVTRQLDPLTLEAQRQELAHRGVYVGRLFWLLVAWLGVVVLLLALTGSAGAGFRLSDPVLVALLGASTANVVGLFFVVARYLFPVRRALTE